MMSTRDQAIAIIDEMSSMDLLSEETETFFTVRFLNKRKIEDRVGLLFFCMRRLKAEADITRLPDGRACGVCKKGTGCLSEEVSDYYLSFTCCVCHKVSLAVLGRRMTCTHCVAKIHVEPHKRFITCIICGPTVRYSSTCNGYPITDRVPDDLAFVCCTEHSIVADQRRMQRKRVSLYQEADGGGLSLIQSETYVSVDDVPDTPLYALLTGELAERHVLFDLSMRSNHVAIPFHESAKNYFMQRPGVGELLLVARPILSVQHECILVQWLGERFNVPADTCRSVIYAYQFLLGTPALVQAFNVCLFFVPFIENDQNAFWKGSNLCVLTFDDGRRGALISLHEPNLKRLKSLHKTLVRNHSMDDRLAIISSIEKPKEETPPPVVVPKVAFNPVVPPNNKHSKAGLGGGGGGGKSKAKKEKKAKTKGGTAGKGARRGKTYNEAVKAAKELDNRLEIAEQAGEAVIGQEQKFYMFLALTIFKKLLKKSAKADRSPEPCEKSPTGPTYQRAHTVFAQPLREVLEDINASERVHKAFFALFLHAAAKLFEVLPPEALELSYDDMCKKDMLRSTILAGLKHFTTSLTVTVHHANVQRDLIEQKRKQMRQSGKVVHSDHPDEDDGWSPPPPITPVTKEKDPLWEKVRKRSLEKVQLEESHAQEQQQRLEKEKAEAARRLKERAEARRLEEATQKAEREEAERKRKREREQERERAKKQREEQEAEVEFNELMEYDADTELFDASAVCLADLRE